MLVRGSIVLACAAVLVLCASMGAVEASIEKEPVRVTHRNSGPRYDIDDVERTRINGADSSENQVLPPRIPLLAPSPTPDSGGSNNNNGEPQIGHVSIRRIFLIPMAPSPPLDWTASSSGGSSSTGNNNGGAESSNDPLASLFGANSNRPFWPFLPPPNLSSTSNRPHHHLFGGDDASGSPTPAESIERPVPPQMGAGIRGGERESTEVHSNERPQRPLIDPIQMMIDMMQQALNPQAAGNIFGDLNKEASASKPQTGPGGESSIGNPSEANRSGTELELANSPTLGANSKNETREDIVEIDGKKYLRKTVTNRHVGDNMIFMTKRLIFTPLNETTEAAASGAPTSRTSTTDAASTLAPPNVLPELVNEESEKRKIDGVEAAAPNSGSGPASEATTTAAAAAPTATSIDGTNKPSNLTPEATTVASSSTPAEETTPKVSLVNRISEAIDRVAERLVEKEPTSTTTKPL